jgi:hypothetical protein
MSKGAIRELKYTNENIAQVFVLSCFRAMTTNFARYLAAFLTSYLARFVVADSVRAQGVRSSCLTNGHTSITADWCRQALNRANRRFEEVLEVACLREGRKSCEKRQ